MHPRARMKHSVAGAAGILVLAVARDGRALGPVDVEVALKGGFGSASVPPDGPSSANVLGYGIGGRAGAVLHGIYAGVSVVNYAGQTVTFLSERNHLIFNVGIWSHGLLAGGEIGYGFSILDRLTVRPQVGLGDALIVTSTPSTMGADGYSVSAHVLYVEPGVTGLVSFGPAFVGADLSAMFLKRASGYGDVTGFTAHLQAGFRL